MLISLCIEEYFDVEEIQRLYHNIIHDVLLAEYGLCF